MSSKRLIQILVALLAPLSAHAAYFGNIQGGTDFPEGSISFADSVVSYLPGMVGAYPTLPNRGADNSLGTPDYAGADCASQTNCTYVSLGDGGSITLRFLDNYLTGSGDSALDLWIFEIGPDVEDTYVEISKDGSTYFGIGKVFGTTSGIDIDAFGFGIDDRFAYVRLTDDTNEGDQTGASVGADIDAVGAISTVRQTVPEPASIALLAVGLAGFGLGRRRY